MKIIKSFQVGVGGLALLVLATFPSLGTTPPVIQLQYVSRPVTAGQSGNLMIHFKISDGFKIPKQPSPKVQLMSSAELEVQGNLLLMEEGTGKDPAYFNALRPLSIQLTPSRTAKRGQHLLEGKFIYFYCSEKEKYCSRSVENLQIPVEVADEK